MLVCCENPAGQQQRRTHVVVCLMALWLVNALTTISSAQPGRFIPSAVDSDNHSIRRTAYNPEPVAPLVAPEPIPAHEPLPAEILPPENYGPPMDGPYFDGVPFDPGSTKPYGFGGSMVAEPAFAGVLEGNCVDCCPWYKRIVGHCDPYMGEGGIGYARVKVAPFEIETTQPFENIRMRVTNAWSQQSPDRAEYFWAGPLRGPVVPETGVNWQRISWQFEQGNDAFSVATEIPLRFVDPEINPNTGGLGDMTVTQKTRLLNGDVWQLTQFMKTYIQTGSARKGLGTGHTALEPGLLFRIKGDDETYWHGEMRYWFPLGGDPNYSGQVLRFGLGFSNLEYTNDMFAIISTLELVTWSVLDGQQTTLAGLQELDKLDIIQVYPGIRIVTDGIRDWGLIEFGISAGFSITDDRWQASMLRVEMRRMPR